MPSNTSTQPGIPGDTYQAARQVYNLRHIYLLIGDQLEQVSARVDLTRLDPYAEGGEITLRLALVTAFQYAEFLPDEMAAEASRKRIDWKYALRLPAQHQGMAARALCAFRHNLLASPAALAEFGRLVDALAGLGLYPRSERETLAPGALARTVCQITRLHELRAAMKAALVALAASAPDWLRGHMPAHWYTRYQTGPLSLACWSSAGELDEEAARVGADILALRERGAPGLLDLPETRYLLRLFEQQFSFDGDLLAWQLPACGGCVLLAKGEMDLPMNE